MSIKDESGINLRDKANELGINVRQEILEILGKATQLLPSIVGNELVLSTFVPMIPSLVFDTTKKELLQEHVSDISNKLHDAKDGLNKEFIHSSLGKKLFRDIITEILNDIDKEKIEYLKQFLIMSYSEKEINAELINAFLKILKDMEPIHMKLFAILKTPEEILFTIAEQRKQNKRSENQRRYGKADYVLYWEDTGMDDINEFYLRTDPIVYTNALKDLVNWHILKTTFIHHWIYFDQTFSGNFESMINEMRRWTTGFGLQFLEHFNKNDPKRTQKSL